MPPTPLDPAALAFRPLVPDDLPVLKGWFDEPHAAPWFRGGRPLAEIVEEFTRYFEGLEPINSYVVSYVVSKAETPIGLCQWERLGDFPDTARAYGATDPETVNCDILIGDPAFAHRGLGAALVRRFLREIAFRDPRFTTCLIDPRAENAIAIRAYEKAGFRHVRTVADPEDGQLLHLMEQSRADLFR
ncbi:MAG: aminoglycoside 6-N-acetyltransferase [Myxococcales bacterium]|nr:aminoglycoside 6-N-acetyltransferase [Myxococcales bacterium]